MSNVFVRDTRAADDSPLNCNTREDQETSADLEAVAGTDRVLTHTMHEKLQREIEPETTSFEWI